MIGTYSVAFCGMISSYTDHNDRSERSALYTKFDAVAVAVPAGNSNFTHNIVVNFNYK